MPSSSQYKQLAQSIFLHAVEAVQPGQLIKKNVRLDHNTVYIAEESIALHPAGKIYVVGAGKATAAMAKALEDILGNYICGGVIIVKYGHTEPLQYISTVEAAHPVPDKNGINGTKKLLQLLGTLSANDLVIALLSGGGSALLIDLPEGCSLEELQQSFDLLLRSGASIEEMNTVRKHLSGVKGGQLAVHVKPARLVTLILSDVVGDPLDVIASGPTVADPTTFRDAWEIIEKYKLINLLPLPVKTHLEMGVQGILPDTPKPENKVFCQTSNYVIGSNAIALEAARKKAGELCLHTLLLGNTITGEASLVAKQLVTQARKTALDSSIPKPALLLMGGETTVTITGKGKGGRNQHLALAAALELTSADCVVILSAGTDGTDGPTDAAGAVIDLATVSIAAGKGIVAEDFLANNDSYHFFAQIGGHIITGPTLTNVMDIMLAIVC